MNPQTAAVGQSVRLKVLVLAAAWLVTQGSSVETNARAQDRLEPRESGPAYESPNAGKKGFGFGTLDVPPLYGRKKKDASNPYGLAPSNQTIDKDNIKTFVTQISGAGKTAIEESEIEQIIDALEATHGVYIHDRDVLAVGKLNADQLVSALTKTLLETGANQKDGDIQMKRKFPIGPAVRNGEFDERQRIPGLGEPSSSRSGQNAFNDNGSQKSVGQRRDYKSKVSRGTDNPQSYHTTYKDRDQKAKGNPYFPPEDSIRDIDNKATEFFSNGKPKYDDSGNELYPNGRRRFSTQGLPLYSNGRPRVDGEGNELHSNGRKKNAADGRPLYANGQPTISTAGTPLHRDGKPRMSADGRPLYANGKPEKSADGVALHPNGQRKYSGDGVGKSPFRTETDKRQVDLVEELYSNGKPAFDADGNRLYSNSQKRTSKGGEFLYNNGRPIADDDKGALATTGDVIAANNDAARKPEGVFTVFRIIDGRIAGKKGNEFKLRPKGIGEELRLDAANAVVWRATGADPIPGTVAELADSTSVRAVVKGNEKYIDGQSVGPDAAPKVIAFMTTSHAGAGKPTDGRHTLTAIVSGELISVSSRELVVAVGPTRAEQTFAALGAVYQNQDRNGLTPIRAAQLRGGRRVEIIAQQDCQFANGKIQSRDKPRALAVTQK